MYINDVIILIKAINLNETKRKKISTSKISNIERKNQRNSAFNLKLKLWRKNKNGCDQSNCVLIFYMVSSIS